MLRCRRAGQVLDLIESNPSIIPKPPAHGPIGARLKIIGTERRQQRQGRNDAGVLIGHEARELVEVADVTTTPTAL